MSELTLTVIKVGFLALLWLFVLSAVSVVRADLFGTRAARARAARAAAPVRPPAARPARRRRHHGAPAPTAAVVTHGVNTGIRVPLGTEPLLIGRGAECALRLDDEYVSTRHAVLRPLPDGWYVEDLGSTNGTFVGGTRIHGPTHLADGLALRVGKTVVELTR